MQILSVLYKVALHSLALILHQYLILASCNLSVANSSCHINKICSFVQEYFFLLIISLCFKEQCLFIHNFFTQNYQIFEKMKKACKTLYKSKSISAI